MSDLNCIKKTIRDATNGSEPNNITGEMTHKQKGANLTREGSAGGTGAKRSATLVHVCVCVLANYEASESNRTNKKHAWELMREGEKG